MASSDQQPTTLELFAEAATRFVTDIRRWADEHSEEINAVVNWLETHQAEIEAFGIWGGVDRACRQTGLYAPASPVAWRTIGEAERDGKDADELRALITSTYGPGGEGHDSLRQELHEATLLQTRQREVEEVLDSLADGRNYVTICGALPLVEGLLAQTHGRWKKSVEDYPLRDRLYSAGALSTEEEATLIVNDAALEMLLAELGKTWKSGPTRVNTIDSRLNRHAALHGTARGWDTAENAIYAVLLLAAAARVAGPLLRP